MSLAARILLGGILAVIMIALVSTAISLIAPYVAILFVAWLGWKALVAWLKDTESTDAG